MQIVYLEDNLHEMLKPIFYEKQENYNQFVVCWICQKIGKDWNTSQPQNFLFTVIIMAE